MILLVYLVVIVKGELFYKSVFSSISRAGRESAPWTEPLYFICAFLFSDTVYSEPLEIYTAVLS